MSQGAREANRVTPLDVEYYQFCREQLRPYFGRVMWASQGLPLRHVVMQELVRRQASAIRAVPSIAAGVPGSAWAALDW